MLCQELFNIEIFNFRSFSRSRSRSRGRRVFRGRGGGGFNQRRFSPKRQGASRGRWENNFRDSRDFRGGRSERFNRERPVNRGGRFGGRFGGRSFSRSPERSPNRNGSQDRRDDDRRNKDRDGRWPEEENLVGKPDLADLDELLKKSR